MYSPGDYHLRVPRERRGNVLFRRFLLARCRRDARNRKAVMGACRDDIFFFINCFVWQFNPNAIGPGSSQLGPFITWSVQDDAVRTILKCIEERSDLVIEKSRDMGASWLCLIIMLWFWLFHPYSKFLCVSRNADAVDDSEDSDSLFWKLDFMLRHLPEWMVGPRDYARKLMSLKNHKNGSMITGQASTGKAGVGGRALAMFVDEFSQVREDWEVYDRTSDTTGCRIFNGTHKGTNTCFHELTVKANTTASLKKLVMHWSQHPDKARGAYHFDRETQRVVYHDPAHKYAAGFAPVTDGSPTGGPCPGLRSPWYDRECNRKGSARGIAADLDINPSGSVEQVFDPLMIHDLKQRYACVPTAECDLEWIRGDAEPVRFHEEAGGPFKLWHRLSDGRPRPGRYVFAADIAQGTGATPSCLSGADADTGEKVFEYANHHIEPKEFAYIAAAVCRLYCDEGRRPARLAWEIPGPGTVFGKHIIALGLRDVYYRTTEHRLKKEQSDTPGWSNSPDSMLNLVINYRDALRAKRFLNRSEFALSECLAFVYGPDGYVHHTGWKDPKDPSAARVNHGDRVVADALCWKLAEEMGRMAGVNPDTRESEKSETQQVGGLAWRAELVKLRSKQSSDWV